MTNQMILWGNKQVAKQTHLLYGLIPQDGTCRGQVQIKADQVAYQITPLVQKQEDPAEFEV